jgi:Leucine-rich repeat (LRR) protein
MFSGLSSLQGLYIYNNQLTTFTSDTFDNLPTLTDLDLDYNQISSLPNGAFSKLSFIKLSISL